jgi:hypothetical protein
MTSDPVAADSQHARESEGKMAQILDQLGSSEGLPVAAIRAANADRTAMVPVILRAFDDSATAGPSLQMALFFAFHLLGQWREKSAYRPLAAFLRRPTKETDPIIGGATTATAHRVMASLFDGDPKALYEVILEPTVDEFIRARMCAALAMVTLRGELPREEAARFLQSCYDSLQPQDECYVWDGWQGAIAMLGLSELTPSSAASSVRAGWGSRISSGICNVPSMAKCRRHGRRMNLNCSATPSRSCRAGTHSRRNASKRADWMASGGHGPPPRPPTSSRASAETTPVRAAAARNSRSAVSIR